MTNAMDKAKKAGYAAVGASTSLVSLLKDRLSAVRDAVDDLGDRVSADVRKEIDEWIAEGENLVHTLGDNTKELLRRGSEAKEDLEDKLAAAREVAEGFVATATHPVVKVSKIRGIGPKYAEALSKAGVTTTAALLERALEHGPASHLAKQTGISVALLESWAKAADLTRVKGIGPETMATLNAVGIASVVDLAEAVPSKLAAMIEKAADSPDVASVPAVKTLQGWIQQAKSLVAT